MKRIYHGLMLAGAALVGAVLDGVALAQVSGGAAGITAGLQTGRGMTRAQALARAEQAFARLDANQDGVLDKSDRAAMEARRFDRLDTNHDGSLSREEFGAGAMMGRRRNGQLGAFAGVGSGSGAGAGMSRAEFVAAALRRFDAADGDHDGSLTMAERAARRAAGASGDAARPASRPASKQAGQQASATSPQQGQ